MKPIEHIQRRMAALHDAGRYRCLVSVSTTEPTVLMHGRQAVLFCSNNYLGLASHPRLIAASADAVQSCGCSSGASRLVSGNLPLFEKLEASVAAWKGTEAALVFNSGFAANTGVVTALAQKGDVVFSDRLNHASIIDGATASGARLMRYHHGDYHALERQLETAPEEGLRLIISDGVFSMDGDCADIRRLSLLAKQYDALLMIDDAHGGGVLGPDGRGTAALQGVAEQVTIHMGTFGKALGSAGAYIACSHAIREYLINTARSFIFSTALPPAVLAASLAAITVVRSEEGEQLRRRVAEHGALMRYLLTKGGLELAEGVTPIIPVMVGEAGQALLLSQQLLQQGYFVQAIRPPTVPQGTSRLRLTVMANHTEEQIEGCAQALLKAYRGLLPC